LHVLLLLRRKTCRLTEQKPVPRISLSRPRKISAARSPNQIPHDDQEFWIFRHTKTLQFTATPERPDPLSAKMLQEPLGGNGARSASR
jgi:hypothetical protein